jgi:CRISPR-associated protein Cmr5
MARTKEQERADFAWQKVNEVRGRNFEKEYRQLARSMFANILTNGLGQTVAFLYAKGRKDGAFKQDDGHATLYQHLSQWLGEKMGWQAPGQAPVELIKKLVDEGTQIGDYRRATTEALAFLTWIKRFAEAEVKGEK